VSVHKRTWTDSKGRKRTAWQVRYDDGIGQRSQTFGAKKDADDFDAKIKTAKREGILAELDAGTESLSSYVAEVWTPTYAGLLSRSTRANYTAIYDLHIAPHLGSKPLRSITPETINVWQAQRINAGAGVESVRKAFVVLGSILQRAAESGRIRSNPARIAKKTPGAAKRAVRPLAPGTVERMRDACSARDAALISVLAYSGMRPGEAVALRWGDVQERTVLVERALGLGEVKGTKNHKTRSVRLLAPLASDLAEWRMRCGRPSDDALVFPSRDGTTWSRSAYEDWRRKAFQRALAAAMGSGKVEPLAQVCPSCMARVGKQCVTPKGRTIEATHVARSRVRVEGRPYDLRHSFASLLLHEGRAVTYVAAQLGHSATMTLAVYGHVIEELDGAPQIDAEAAIRAARDRSPSHNLPTMSPDRPQALHA
jgi:integrase